MLEIDPVSHLRGDLVPFVFVPQYGLAAFSVVFLDRDLDANVFFGDAEFFFDTEFNGKSVRIPTSFAFHLKSAHGLIATDQILQGTGDDVVDTGHPVGAGRTFIEHKSRRAFAVRNALLKGLVSFPTFQYLFFKGGQVQSGKLSISSGHSGI